MIFYFSGTGNSRHAAQLLGERLNDEVLDMASFRGGALHGAAATVGFVFPVYGWAPPQVVMQFIQGMTAEQTPAYLYFIAVCGDDTGKTADVFAEAIRRKGWHVDAGFSLTMPNTYVCLPGFDVDKPEVERLKIEAVPARIEYIAQAVKERRVMSRFDCHEGALPVLKTYFLGGFFRQFLMNPKMFRVNEGCVGCGRCEQVCPLGNILMKQNQPHWGKYCAHCLACYHACPKHAVEYDGQTKKKGQYKRFL
jgi:ferredoxin/flavodoxin